MSEYWILDGKEPVQVSSVEEWARYFETADRHVAQDVIGDVRISTVFLGLNHRWGEGSPLLFETMIFGGPHDEHQTRASTWDEAVSQHGEALQLVRSGLN